MGNRRMFSSRITESTRFLKMPSSTQNLYFHLGMQADDDGIVEAYPVMCTIKATEDDLRILVSKGFITILNNDMVTYINDWLENNMIRADRKVDSIYKDLLLQVLPEVEVKESKESYYSRCKTICQTNDSQVTDIRQPIVSISKDKLSKDKLSKDRNKKDIVVIPSEQTTKLKFTIDSFEMLCVESIIHSCLEVYPNSKVPVTQKEKEKWAIEIDRMKRIDNRSEAEIRQALQYALNNSFWKGNIRSTKKFREKFEVLLIQSNGSQSNKTVNRQQQLQDDFVKNMEGFLNE